MLDNKPLTTRAHTHSLADRIISLPPTLIILRLSTTIFFTVIPSTAPRLGKLNPAIGTEPLRKSFFAGTVGTVFLGTHTVAIAPPFCTREAEREEAFVSYYVFLLISSEAVDGRVVVAVGADQVT
ncbi:hypothetical protein KCU73_g11527, partial [Aureobasidium melanogenum]